MNVPALADNQGLTYVSFVWTLENLPEVVNDSTDLAICPYLLDVMMIYACVGGSFMNIL